MSRTDFALICPTFAGSARDASDFAEEFGTYTDRYVAQYPPNWMELWNERIKVFQPVERMAAAKRRAEIQRALVRIPGRTSSYDSAKSWADNAAEAAMARSFPHVVGDYDHPEPYRNWPAEVDSIRRRRPRPWVIGSSVDDYRQLSERLIRVSPSAFVIDPYFDPLSADGAEITRTLVRLLRDSPCFELHFVLARERSGRKFAVEPGKAFEEELRWSVAPELQIGRIVVVHVIDDKNRRFRPFRMHDRYFLTLYGARWLSNGFMLDPSRDRALENKVRNVPREEIPDLFKTYVDGLERPESHKAIARFRICGER